MPLTLPREQIWTDRRRRTAQLRERHPFAAQVLGLYAALLDVQEQAFEQVLAERPAAEDAALFAATRVLPGVVAATLAAGPEQLADSVRDGLPGLDFEALVVAWLHNDEQGPVNRYLAQACATPVLEALGNAAGAACTGPRDDRHCPICGGPPQLSVMSASGESLVSGRRHLVCARCVASWPYARMTCAGCGEQAAAKLPVYAEEGTTAGEASGHVVPGAAAVRGAPLDERARFPHMRIEGCETCGRYLIGIDVSRQGHAVPVVDELAAMPLHLYAQEQGLTKLTTNLMGM